MKLKTLSSLMLGSALALSLLAGCGNSAASASGSDLTPAPKDTPASTASDLAPAPAPEESAAPEQNDPHSGSASSEGSGSKVAGAEDMTTVEEVVEEGMVPVYAATLADGVYPVEMKSSSSMFKADRCELVVENGEMSVVLYMSSEAYPWMYAGTAAEAAEAAEADWLPLTDGTFTLPLEALDEGESFAAFSKRKELWYDRTLLFRADSLPVEAFAEGFFTTAESLGLGDGGYTAAVTLGGGSGRASVQSPTQLRVSGGKAEATVVWSSGSYDYMLVDGERYEPLTLEPGSTFVIPVRYFDRPLTVYADTTAMSQPYEIEYTLTFDSASVTAVEP